MYKAFQALPDWDYYEQKFSVEKTMVVFVAGNDLTYHTVWQAVVATSI